ncbi:hypothetical protein LX16_1308 [Stackebrandtia albiflava]|uniref:ARG and Rhodanese-Phosphatase-superfamily-associated domain-containing protein n=2 Tax=Stackebrandtia albiflava TaxID=406432 RepID=A0A562VCN7_9ACTN|nr:hypothetical protein LX16_1308 [Stackebrandtia albiflava]
MIVDTGEEFVEAAYGTRLSVPGSRDPERRIRLHHRMHKRLDDVRFRFLPMHVAMEGFLLLQFGGPPVAWQEWSQHALHSGTAPRTETWHHGSGIDGLDEAMRRFEIHDGQCGVAVYIGDALASVFATPHPDDFRALYPALLDETYGELIARYAGHGDAVSDMEVRFDESAIRDLADIRRQAAAHTESWRRFHDDVMTADLFADRHVREIRAAGDFVLRRFTPTFTQTAECHIGEEIVDYDTGQVAYLKTFRLSQTQIRRGRLLTVLGDCGWRLSDAAARLRVTPEQFGIQLDRAGFGHLLKRHVLDGFRHRARR